MPSSSAPYRYIFKRGGIRFIVLDAYWREEHEEWLRQVLLQPDDSSVSIVLEHKTRGEFPWSELKGRHNVKLVLSSHICIRFVFTSA